MAPVYVAIAMGIGGAIATEAALSFLGIGIQPPNASWGSMIANYLTYVPAGSWWMEPFRASPSCSRSSASSPSATACATPPTPS